MTDLPRWLAAADEVLSNPDSSEAAVDDVLADAARLDMSSLPGSTGPSQLDPVMLQRVIAVLTARRAAIAVELADLGRQRVELSRRHRGVVGYARTTLNDTSASR